ncbi:MAG TPA: glycosyltransferase family 4 protein [Dehalococcoidia bacterium]|nr:glycosyltransferase family 4 protein [Dehalococcoidia bacterium]
MTTENQDRALKIALVAPYDLSTPGGVNAHIRSLASSLRRLGHEATIYGPASKQGALEPGEIGLGGSLGVHFGGTVSGMGLNPLLDRKIRGILRRERFDVVHVHEPLTPILPWLFLRNARAPIVGTFHVHREEGHSVYAAFSWFLKMWSRRLDYRIAVSEAARQTVARYFPGDYDMLPNGVDVARYSEPTEPPPLTPGRREIVFVGRLEGRKGLEYLIRAIPSVVADAPNARLVVVGDGPEREDCEQLARDLCPDGAVLFAGAVDENAKAGYLQAAEIFCSPATHGESFGIVLLEAMAAGRPIVASAIEGYAGLLVADEAGLLVPPRDPDALAAALIHLLDNEAERTALGRRAAEAAEKYDWLAIARRIEAIYRRLLERETVRPG